MKLSARQFFPRNQRGSVLPALVLVVAVIAVGLFASTRDRSNNPQGPSRTNAPSRFVNSDATTALVYGVRFGSGAEIRQINSDGTNDSIIGKLNSASRDVNIVGDNELVYIGGVSYENGEFGRGKTIEKATTSEDPLLVEKLYEIPARDAWAIDELIVSPDKQYIAWWEVKNPPGVEDHSSYSSRTWVMPLAGGTKVRIAEETETQNQKTKPLFFDNQNRLYTDTVAQNPYNFYLGIKRFATSGQDLGSFLSDGSYNSWPKISPDGKYAVYSMYDGGQPAAGGGTTPATRVSNVNPNTLILHNLTNDQKTTVANSSSGSMYDSHIVWAHDSSGFAFEKLRATQYSPLLKTLANGMWRFNVGDRDPKKLRDFTKNEDGTQEYVIGYDRANDTVLYGLRNSSERGNLSSLVSSPVLKEVNAYNPSMGDTPKQYLTSGGYEYVSMVPKARGERFALRAPESVLSDASRLTLRDFELPSPPPPRLPDPTPGPSGSLPTNPRTNCAQDWQARGYPSYEACEYCPLYLYPTKPTNVSVKVNNAKVLTSNVPYGANGFEVLANPNGKLVQSDGSVVGRIDYDYATSNVPAPTRGYVVAKDNLSTTLWRYAVNLGLNNSETQDFVQFWLAKLPESPYYFMGHYSDDVVKQKLDLAITPKPDTLVQSIMYFKPLAAPVAAEAPQFAPILPRTGFVAVDFSGKIDY